MRRVKKCAVRGEMVRSNPAGGCTGIEHASEMSKSRSREVTMFSILDKEE
jgi:hypothetical protein